MDWADGACLMMRVRDFLSVGGFDPAYFLYVEEVDLQLRLRMQGLRIRLVESARACQEPGNYTLYLKHRNLTYLTGKFSSVLSAWPWLRHWLIDSARMVRRGRLGQPLWGIRGILDGRAGRMGPPPVGLLCMRRVGNV
ncbi:glycosyltransferase family 2 protein [Raineyella fluvialis]|uniref:glycosyltransferase family 2 protein n=1 Tax=Raineyella fluvialis TaxID=2662261 RepID=UPI003BB21FAB